MRAKRCADGASKIAAELGWVAALERRPHNLKSCLADQTRLCHWHKLGQLDRGSYVSSNCNSVCKVLLERESQLRRELEELYQAYVQTICNLCSLNGWQPTAAAVRSTLVELVAQATRPRHG